MTSYDPIEGLPARQTSAAQMRNHNDRILDLMRGLPAQPTAGVFDDPNNAGNRNAAADLPSSGAAFTMLAKRVQHVKLGSTYRVIGEAHLKTEFLVDAGSRLVVYQSEQNGKLWVRPTGEFQDGRFFALPPPLRATRRAD